MYRSYSLLIIGAGVLSGCATEEVLVAHSVTLVSAPESIAEDQLLDVGVLTFDPGVPEGEVDEKVAEELIEDGTFVSIRRTESLYMAVQLRDTLQKSGNWGAVWVTPRDSTAADLTVAGKILHSDGDIVQVQITAVDATGRTWLDKPYQAEIAAGAYNRQRYPDLDPYQDLFNSIANDLAAARADLSAKDTRDIRTVGSLRYASELSPTAFDGYVAENRDGIYETVRLPATDDPMFGRTQQVRQREQVFFETLNDHYEKFTNAAAPSYDSWREYAREESIAIRELTRSARWRTGIGIATIVASLLYGADSDNDSFSNRVIRDSMMYIGADFLQSSAVRKQEKRLHTETLEELSTSFDEEVAPLVVEVSGVQHRLVGTADVQYEEWRNLLQQLFISETGFAPADVEIYAEPTPEIVPVAEEAAVEAVPAGSAEAEPDGAPATEEAPAEATPATEKPPEAAPIPLSPGTDKASVQEANTGADGGKASGV